MRIGKTYAPAAAPIFLHDILCGLIGLLKGDAAVTQFGNEIKRYFGVKHCYLISSGKAALTVILRAMHQINPQRNEVIIPAYTCYSVPAAIKKAGLKVKLCDVDPNNLDFNYEQLSELFDKNQNKSPITNLSQSIQSQLLAILPTHLFGCPADINKQRKTIKDQSIFVVEDAAQAMGLDFGDMKLGSIGDVGFFSLGRGKAISTIEGGVIITDRDDLAEKIEHVIEGIERYSLNQIIKLFFYGMFITVFQHPFLFWLPKGLPFLKIGETIYETDFPIRKMSAFQAGISRNWQKRLKQNMLVREQNVKDYISKLGRISGIMIPFLSDKIKLPLIRLPIRVKDLSWRGRILKESDSKGLGMMPSYPEAVCNIPEIQNEFDSSQFSGAIKLSRELVTLPTHFFIGKKERERVLSVLSKMI
ncbi:DegT/DnrJ/EryC1/StrS family aminotransferase [Thermodesulfobacteriota bacterium]